MYNKSFVKNVVTLFVTLLVTIFPIHCSAMQIYKSLSDISEEADLIFIGGVVDKTCRYGVNQRMIFTDVRFDLINLIHQGEKCKEIVEDGIILTFAGGQIGEEIMRVSDVPSFDHESKYLIFTRMDEKTYASPIIGGFQGLFPIIEDEVTGILYPLTYGKKGIVEIKGNELILKPRVKSIRGGVVIQASDKSLSKLFAIPPKQAGEDSKYGAKASVSKALEQVSQKIMNLNEFIDEIRKSVK